MSDSSPAPEELAREAEKARLLLEAARYLNETLDPGRVHDRFRELLADAVPHGGVVVSSYDDAEGLIRCDYAWVDGNRLDPEILPPLKLNRQGGGMQSRVITTGEPLLVNDVPEQVKDPRGVYYDVDREGHIRRLPDEGPPGVQAAMMIPVKHEGRVVGVVQLMNDRASYSDEQLELAEALVGLMGAAVRNARLHEAAQAAAAARARAEATAAEREHAARLLEAVGDGVFLLDDEGVVRFWNRAAELVTQIPGSRARGRSVDDLFGDLSRIVAEIPVAEGSTAPRPVTLPVDVEGAEFWLSFVAVRSPAGVVYAFRDLTTERRLEEAKSDFIATISHELRTPMTAVLGAAKTLMRQDVKLPPGRRRQLLEMIEAEAARLSAITEQVLLASRLDRDELPLESGRIDLKEVVRAAVDVLQPRMPPSISLSTVIDAHGSAALGDRDRVEQVLVNLIDNAIKYSPAGGAVTVSAERVREVIRIAVEDEGIGVPPSEQAAIFEKFYRADPNLRQAPSGSGLGLYISRELVHRMGGRIGVESRPGVGSTFFVELPSAS
jgi:two-component system, OmpR family, phosphate regulon sensor histidine kinase PhoR